jgi:hypothetical protein
MPTTFSFTLLRISTILASLAGLVGCYALVRETQQCRKLAIVGALVLGFNPIYYALSNTFMTDILFATLAIWVTVLLCQDIQRKSLPRVLMGATLAVAATLSRPLGIVVPLAFSIVEILRRGTSLRLVLRASIPLISSLFAYLSLNTWMTISGRQPESYGAQIELAVRALISGEHIAEIFANAFVALAYLGLFLLPVLIFTISDLFRGDKRRFVSLVLIGVLTCAVGAAARLHSGPSFYDKTYYGTGILLMPMASNIFIKSGIGPLTLRDTYILHLDHVPTLPVSFWIVITVAGVIGAVLLVVNIGARVAELMPPLLRRAQISESDTRPLFLLLCGGIYLLPLLPAGFYDRYLIPIVPCFMAGILRVSTNSPGSYLRIGSKTCVSAFALIMAFSIYAIAGTRDYLTWNRVRWNALGELMNSADINPGSIDGGYEFNGLFLYEGSYITDQNSESDFGRSWWWVRGNTYQVGFGAVRGYTVIKEYSYLLWLPPHIQKIVLLRKGLTDSTKLDRHTSSLSEN